MTTLPAAAILATSCRCHCIVYERERGGLGGIQVALQRREMAHY